MAQRVANDVKGFLFVRQWECRKVDEELVASDIESPLAADVAKASTEFSKESVELVDHGLLDVTFMRGGLDAEKFEGVRVACRLVHHLGIFGG
jgi:hypothetical protein